MKIHPREEKVRAAENDLRKAISDARAKYDLTAFEELRIATQVFADVAGSIAKYGIREERHGDPNKPGGLE